MKVSKAIIGAAIGTAVGGTAGYFIGREVEKRNSANEDYIESDVRDTPAIDICPEEAEGDADVSADEEA